jgi:Uma2 family endonuclease
MSSWTANRKIEWKKLPEDCILDEEPVQNIDQPLLAAALREILEIAGLIGEQILIASHLGICTTIDDQLVIKPPDWFYARNVQPLTNNEIRRSYTPNLEGDRPDIVMEFISVHEKDEYWMKASHPIGKWFFYEQILQVPIYAVFEQVTGNLYIHRLDSVGGYQLEKNNTNNRYWIDGVGLFLGVWQGTKAERTGYWLRWWDESGEMLLWGAEMVERERQEKEIAQQQAEQERVRSSILVAQLRAAGIEPEA